MESIYRWAWWFAALLAGEFPAFHAQWGRPLAGHSDMSAVLHDRKGPDEVVSDEAEELILVDASDREIGYASKGACHDRAGVLHRAFSLFVFNADGELLVQRRAADKRLWPLYWSNSCCSHPRRGEAMEEAIHRRLHQELRIRSDLQYLYRFQYQAAYGDAGSERELCWVYAGQTADRVRANRTEIADWRWIRPATLERELISRPERFTPWFKFEWPLVRAHFHGATSRLESLLARGAALREAVAATPA